MGRRYFYAVVDETYEREERQRRTDTGSWENYESNRWYQDARRKSGRKPL